MLPAKEQSRVASSLSAGVRKSQSQRSDQTSAGVYLARWRRGRGLSRKISPSARTRLVLGSIWRGGGGGAVCPEKSVPALGPDSGVFCVSTGTFDHNSPCFWWFCTFQEFPEQHSSGGNAQSSPQNEETQPVARVRARQRMRKPSTRAVSRTD